MARTLDSSRSLSLAHTSVENTSKTNTLRNNVPNTVETGDTLVYNSVAVVLRRVANRTYTSRKYTTVVAPCMEDTWALRTVRGRGV